MRGGSFHYLFPSLLHARISCDCCDVHRHKNSFFFSRIKTNFHFTRICRRNAKAEKKGVESVTVYSQMEQYGRLRKCNYQVVIEPKKI